MREKIDKICEMAAVMQKAMTLDDELVAVEQETLTRLKLENDGLREMLHIKDTLNPDPVCDKESQTEDT